MKTRLLAAVSVGLVVAAMAIAQDADKSKPAKPAAPPKIDADDVNAIYQLVDQQLGAAVGKARQDPKAGLEIMDKLAKTLDGLKPTKPQAQQLVKSAQAAVKRYRTQIQSQLVSMEEVLAKLKANPADQDAIAMYGAKMTQELGPIASDEPERAKKKLDEAKKFLASLRDKSKDNADVQKAIEQATGQFSQIERMITSALKLKELIGKDATALTADVWVNGTALTDEDLKGKVVMLDFWAVWCGPCVSTFPHLREWHEKYASKGLVMVGVTGYYNFTWDADGQRAKRSQEKVTEEQEQEMLKQFAAKNKLEHVIAIDKASKMAEFYGVTGIPHVVLIDRHGKIRLIKVGAGPDNAKEIEETIGKLIGEKA